MLVLAIGAVSAVGPYTAPGAPVSGSVTLRVRSPHREPVGAAGMLTAKVLARLPVFATVMVPVVPVQVEFSPATAMAALHQPPATPEPLVGTVPTDERQATV